MLVDVKPLREAFLNSGLGPAELARRLNWFDSKGNADASRLNRQLGIQTYQLSSTKKRYKHTFRRQKMSYDTALKIAEAMHLDPIDVGL